MQITEIFYSIQGEGIQLGLPTIFIRTTGCNLRCSYCDTTHAYKDGISMNIDHIISQIHQYECQNVCITGGEPLLQKEIKQLIINLQKEKYTICLETNGSKSIRHLTNRDHLIISMDMKMPSSKMHIHNKTSNILHLTKNDQLKCIIQNKEDYEYAKKLLKKTKPKCSIIFQPAWGTKIKDVASWILTDNLSVRLGIQLHKMIWGANTNR